MTVRCLILKRSKRDADILPFIMELMLRRSKRLSKKRTEVIKKSLGIDGKRVVGVVGRLRKEKGQTILLDAIVKVIKTIPHAMLLVIGDGPDRVSLELRAKSLGIDSDIIWLGQKNPGRSLSFYAIMDVVALPSSSKGSASLQLKRRRQDCRLWEQGLMDSLKL